MLSFATVEAKVQQIAPENIISLVLLRSTWASYVIVSWL
jgi:hypothetical protein